MWMRSEGGQWEVGQMDKVLVAVEITEGEKK
jgi:hypothetical protein